jgi:hypothetical protein
MWHPDSVRLISGAVISSIFFLSVLSSCCVTTSGCFDTNLTSTTKIQAIMECNDELLLDTFLSGNESFYIVRSESEYDSLFSEECNSSIDFSQYQLVIGVIFRDKEVESFDYKFMLTCETNYYKLFITPKSKKIGSTGESKAFFYQIQVPATEVIDILKVFIVEKEQ